MFTMANIVLGGNIAMLLVIIACSFYVTKITSPRRRGTFSSLFALYLYTLALYYIALIFENYSYYFYSLPVLIASIPLCAAMVFLCCSQMSSFVFLKKTEKNFYKNNKTALIISLVFLIILLSLFIYTLMSFAATSPLLYSVFIVLSVVCVSTFLSLTLFLIIKKEDKYDYCKALRPFNITLFLLHTVSYMSYLIAYYHWDFIPETVQALISIIFVAIICILSVVSMFVVKKAKKELDLFL